MNGGIDLSGVEAKRGGIEPQWCLHCGEVNEDESHRIDISNLFNHSTSHINSSCELLGDYCELAFSVKWKSAAFMPWQLEDSLATNARRSFTTIIPRIAVRHAIQIVPSKRRVKQCCWPGIYRAEVRWRYLRNVNADITRDLWESFDVKFSLRSQMRFQDVCVLSAMA